MPIGYKIKNGKLIKYHGNKAHIIIPEKVTSIEDKAFYHCENLISVIIPNSVTKIGDQAFSGCTSLASVAIPNSVTGIGSWAFSGCTSMTSLIIPDSVSEIGSHAFNNCTNLASVAIPNSVTEIRRGAFKGCTSLTSVVIPDSVTKIENEAFSRCTSLTILIISDSVNYIDYRNSFHNTTVICGEGSYAHRYCVNNHLTFIFDFQYEAFGGLIPPGIEMLSSPFLADEEKPFIFISYSHKDRDRVLPILKTLYESGWKIWYDEGLTIGDSYDETLEAHVKNCSVFLLFVTENSLKSHYIAENEIPWAIEFHQPIVKCILDEGEDYEINEGSVIATVSPSAIEPALGKINGLTKGERREAKGISVAFDPANRREAANDDGCAYCLYAPQSAATAKAILLEAKNGGCILYDAVENRADEERLQSAASLIVFLDKAFLSDQTLTKLLTKAYQTGKDITVCRLEDVEPADYPPELSELDKMHALNFVHGITPDMNKNLVRHLQKRGCRDTAALPGFEYEKTDEGIVIKSYMGTDLAPKLESAYGGIPVVEIGESAFENCKRLKSFSIPDGVRKIGDSAFEGCTNLPSVVIPDSVTEIGMRAFEGCTNLSSVIIPDSVTEIGKETFYGCTSLSSIAIPNSVTEIGKRTFYGCTSLSSVAIPNSVTEIGWYAFEGCTSLTSVVIPDSVKEIQTGTFEGCTSLASVVIPNSVKEIGSLAFEGCTSLTSVIIPYSVKGIGSSAFEGCTNLTSVIIPDSVTSIWSCAFRYCSNLTEIILPDNLKVLEHSAFTKCTSLTSLTCLSTALTNNLDRLFVGCKKLIVTCMPRFALWRYCKKNRIPTKAPSSNK